MAFNNLISTKQHFETNINKVIILRCIHGRQPQKLKVMPTISKATGQPLGIESLTDEEKKKRLYTPDKTSHRIITDGTTFNLADDIDRLDWNWVQYSDFIAASRDESLYDNSPVAYYVEDLEADLKAELSKGSAAFEAESWVRQISAADLVDKARLLGQDMSLHAPGEVLVFLLDVARRTPERIEELKKDRFKDERLFLYKLLDKGIVRKNSVGIFYYDNTKLGTDETQVLNWMTAARNSDVVELLWDRMYPNMQRGQRLVIPSALEEVEDPALHPVRIEAGSQHLSVPQVHDPLQKLQFDAQRIIDQYDARAAANRITQDELDEEKRTGNLSKLRRVAAGEQIAATGQNSFGDEDLDDELGFDGDDAGGPEEGPEEGQENGQDDDQGFTEGSQLLVGSDNEPFPSAPAGHEPGGNIIRPAAKRNNKATTGTAQ